MPCFQNRFFRKCINYAFLLNVLGDLVETLKIAMKSNEIIVFKLEILDNLKFLLKKSFIHKIRSLSNVIYIPWPVPDDNNSPYYMCMPDNVIHTSGAILDVVCLTSWAILDTSSVFPGLLKLCVIIFYHYWMLYRASKRLLSQIKISINRWGNFGQKTLQATVLQNRSRSFS